MDQLVTPDLDHPQPQAAARPRRRWLGALIVMLAIAALAGLGWWLTQRGPAETAAPQGGAQGGAQGGGPRRGPATTVGVAVAANMDLPVVIEALGTVIPAANVVVRPQVAGVIAEVLYREGEVVAKDQPLVTIDPRPFQIALDEALGMLARDESLLKNAQITLERYRKLLSQDSIARQEVDTQSALFSQLQGTVSAGRAQVAMARLNLAYTRITAPITGRVGLRVVDVGNYVSAGDANGVALITQVVPIDVLFTLPEDDVPRVQARVAKGGALSVAALDRNRAIALSTGTFLTLDNQIDTATGTVKGKARFDNVDGKLFPGQFVNIQMRLDTIPNAVVVPTAAVRHGSEGDYVHLLNAENIVSLRRVKRGATVADKAAITEGIAVGDRVVVEGGDRLVEGARVQLPGEAPAARAPRAGGDQPADAQQGRQRRQQGEGRPAGEARPQGEGQPARGQRSNAP